MELNPEVVLELELLGGRLQPPRCEVVFVGVVVLVVVAKVQLLADSGHVHI